MAAGVSAETCQKSSQIDREKKLMNVEHRTFNIERRINVFCLF